MFQVKNVRRVEKNDKLRPSHAGFKLEAHKKKEVKYRSCEASLASSHYVTEQ